MRKTVARRMSESAREVPHFPLTVDPGDRRPAGGAGEGSTPCWRSPAARSASTTWVIKAAAVALMQVRDANASYTPEGIALHHHADIAMAVAVPGGLITPIIRNAEQKGLAQIAAEAKDLAERARTKKLKPEEFQGGTFSISNLGMFGSGRSARSSTSRKGRSCRWGPARSGRWCAAMSWPSPPS